MAMDDIRPPKRDRLEQLKERLYRRDEEIVEKPRSALRHHEHSVPTDWSHEREEKEQTKVTQKPSQRSRFWGSLFWFAVVFFVVSVVFAFVAVKLQSNRISGDRIDIDIVTRAFVDGGEELPVTVTIKNRNVLPLRGATLFLEYPGRGGEDDIVSRVVEIGQIAKDEKVEQGFTVALFGEPGQDVDLTARLEYTVPDSTSTFQTYAETPVTIKSTPLLVTLDTPTTILSGQVTEFSITVSPQTDEILTDMVLEVEYPSGFEFQESSVVPAPGSDSRWKFPLLAPGEKITIQVIGSFDGFAGDEASLKAYVGNLDPATGGIAATYHAAAQILRFAEPFMDTQLVVNGQEFVDVATAAGGQNLNVKLVWDQLLDEPLYDVQLAVWIDGNVFNRGSVEPGEGFYDSASGLIVWNKTVMDGLDRVKAGDHDSFDFQIGTYPLVGGGSQVIRDPEISIRVDVLGTNSDGEVLSIENATILPVRFHSGLTLGAENEFYGSVIANSGPMPPRANFETTYTIVWEVRNSSNRLRDAVVTTKLPIYVDWKNVVVPGGSGVSYDANSRTVSWDLGTVEPAIGYTTAPEKVSFQISVRPSQTHIGQVVQTTGDVVLQATDIFTETALEVKKPPHTTKLTNSVGVGASGEVEP